MAVCVLVGLRFLLRRCGLLKRPLLHPRPWPHPGSPGPHPPHPCPHHHHHHPFPPPHPHPHPHPHAGDCVEGMPCTGMEVPLMLADDLQYDKGQAVESKA